MRPRRRPVAVFYQLSRRAMTASESPTRLLVEETCRRFLETCGWPLRFRTESTSESSSGLPERLWTRSLSDGRGTLGELVLDLFEDERLDAEFLQMTKAAELVASLLEEALKAHAAAEVSRGEVETLARIGSSVPRQSDLPSALNQLLRAVTQLTGFRCSAFFLLDPSGQHLTLRLKHEVYSTEIPAPRRLLGEDVPDLVALGGVPFLVRRSVHVAAAEWLPRNMATAACVAVRSAHSPVGTLWAFDRRDRQLEKRELDVLESIAAQLSVLLERAVLIRESESEKKLRRHLRAAVETQPERDLREPGPDCGFEAAGVCRSALDIGGDLIELVPLGRHRTLIAIGDASGDGVPAAMVMAIVRGAVRALAAATDGNAVETDRLMRDVNRALCGVTPSHQFMSLLVGVLDARNGSFVYTNAGHPTPLHVQGEVFGELESHGMLLGVLDEATYERSKLMLRHGDLLVLFTDGVSEAMGRDQRMFRSSGIAGAVRSALGGSAREVADAIWSRLVSHQTGGGAADDRSLLVVKMR
jgi:phosphoserine phosphatase RsbU/P